MNTKVWKKGFAATLAVAALTGISFVGNDVNAAYTLSSEVTTATPALLEATQIGVKTYNTNDPALAAQPNKDAIVVMSFGTTFKDTRDKTITATVKEIQEQHPNVKVITAFTSHIIIDRIKANEGLTYPTPEEALDQLKAEGYNRVALATLDVIPGIEYNYKSAVFNGYKHNFKKMTMGTPLMYWMGQEDQADDVAQVVQAVATQFPKQGPTDAVLIMAHGTPDPSNAYYSVIQNRIDSLGLKNTYIYTVEGNPRLENIIPILKAKGIDHVTLMPFMMVAGDHANNDMAGDEPDSHKSQLLDAGFKVDTYLHGLGENQQIRDIYSARADEAWQALESTEEAK